MKKLKKYNKFCIIDLVVAAFCLVKMLVLNGDQSTGLAALESVGDFALYWILMWMSWVLFAVVSIIKYILYKNKQKERK